MEKRPSLKSIPKRSPKPELPPLPSVDNLPIETGSVSDVNEVGRFGTGSDLELDPKNILRGIIFAEIFGKPKGCRRYRK